MLAFVYQHWGLNIFLIDWEQPKTIQNQPIYDSPHTSLRKLYSDRFPRKLPNVTLLGIAVYWFDRFSPNINIRRVIRDFGLLQSVHPCSLLTHAHIRIIIISNHIVSMGDNEGYRFEAWSTCNYWKFRHVRGRDVATAIRHEAHCCNFARVHPARYFLLTAVRVKDTR